MTRYSARHVPQDRKSSWTARPLRQLGEAYLQLVFPVFQGDSLTPEAQGNFLKPQKCSDVLHTDVHNVLIFQCSLFLREEIILNERASLISLQEVVPATLCFPGFGSWMRKTPSGAGEGDTAWPSLALQPVPGGQVCEAMYIARATSV